MDYYDLEQKYNDLSKLVNDMKTRLDEAALRTNDTERTKLNRNIDEDSKRIIREIAGAGSTVVGGRLEKTSAQTITTSTDTKIAFNVVTFESGVTCDTTNNRITIETAGVYHVSGQVAYDTPVANKIIQTMVYLNNNMVAQSQHDTTTTNLVTNNVTYTGELAVGDYIELNTFHNCGGNETLQNTGINTFVEVIGG